MIAQPVQTVLTWRSLAALDARLRARAAEEVRALAWTLSEMEALLHDAHRATSLDHAWLMPRIELRLPLYDLDRRLRIAFTYVDRPRIVLLDEDGRKLADVTLH